MGGVHPRAEVMIRGNTAMGWQLKEFKAAVDKLIGYGYTEENVTFTLLKQYNRLLWGRKSRERSKLALKGPAWGLHVRRGGK